jgi:hypothetical protein
LRREAVESVLEQFAREVMPAVARLQKESEHG